VTGKGPFPGDSPVAIARRVANAYRSALRLNSRSYCDEIDQQMIGMGQRWVVPQLVTANNDDYVDAEQAADLAGVKMDTIRQWRARGRLHGELTANGWRYLVGDVRAVAEGVRTRRPRRPRNADTDQGRQSAA
jgi:hypothetical protein